MRKPAYLMGVTMNGKHSFRDYHMIIGNTNPVGAPEPYTQTVDVPFGSPIDLTEFTGGVTYVSRPITLKMGCMNDVEDWPRYLSQLYSDLQGKTVKFVFDEDKNFFYVGRATLSDYDRAQELGTFTISSQANPYKYDILSAAEEWLWDTFNFNTDIARGYCSIEVGAEPKTVIIAGSQKPVSPTISSNAQITVEFEGQEYQLQNNVPRTIYDIVLKDGKNELIFKGGPALVSVDFRGGYL